MNSKEFRIYGKQMVEFVADFWENVQDRTPLPDVKPGYISDVVRTIYRFLFNKTLSSCIAIRILL